MLSEDFWLVEIGRGMGPLSFGMTRSQVVGCLNENGLADGVDPLDEDPEVYVKAIETMIAFTSKRPQVLMRLDVDDDRVNFAKWDIINKPIHKVVRLFKSQPTDTLWCDYFEEDEQAIASRDGDGRTTAADAELMRSGTLWLPALGLGFSLDQGLVATVHICDPKHAPKYGSGAWNVPQQKMSETGIIPRPMPRAVKPSFARPILNIVAVLALGILAWRAITLQLRWNAAPDVPAIVVAVDPPPPEPFGNTFTVKYADPSGQQQQVVLDRMQFYVAPKLDEQVKIRFLPEAPDKPLGPNRIGDVGLNLAIPYACVIGMIYCVLQVAGAAFGMIRNRPWSREHRQLI